MFLEAITTAMVDATQKALAAGVPVNLIPGHIDMNAIVEGVMGIT